MRALHTFTAQNQKQISMQKGDIIQVGNKDENWGYGAVVWSAETKKSTKSKPGYFPRKFATVINWPPSRASAPSAAPVAAALTRVRALFPCEGKKGTLAFAKGDI